MGMSESALIGLACVLSKGQSPELEKLSSNFELKEQAAISQVVSSGFCESREFEKLLTLDHPSNSKSINLKMKDFNYGTIATQCVGCKE